MYVYCEFVGLIYFYQNYESENGAKFFHKFREKTWFINLGKNLAEQLGPLANTKLELIYETPARHFLQQFLLHSSSVYCLLEVPPRWSNKSREDKIYIYIYTAWSSKYNDEAHRKFLS